MLRHMYGLDVGTDMSPRIGHVLESLDLTQFQVQLRLDSLDGISLSIESDFSIQRPGAVATTFERPPDAARDFADLLGVQVVEAVVTAPGTLTLR